MKISKEKLLPFILSAVILLLDQITKAVVVSKIAICNYSSGYYETVPALFGDFLRIIHVTNKGVAFSMGNTLGETARRFLFCVSPLVVIAIVVATYFRSDEFTKLQRFAICSIIGGGLGNLVDRFFRPDGVVDFIDIKFYGLFGMERWPTFNVADSAVVVGGVLLLGSYLIAIICEQFYVRKNYTRKAGD